MSLAYRADIDGLRAIAVGSVVLFHGHIPGFTGGFVGVDVFFVISGFLITSILYRDVSAHRFSLVDFYDHRVRRIFPALFTMLAVVTLLAAVVLTPRQMLAYAQSLVPSALFFANIHFESVLDYFGPRADEVPLLHLWSLAVEEQYYILFPVTLFVLLRYGKRTVAAGVIAALTIASLVYAQWAVRQAPSEAFFFLTSRAWELFVGSLLALVAWPRVSARVAGWIGLAGVVAIMAPVFLYSRDTAFPGLAALPPVLGAAALIYAGKQAPEGAVTRVLSHPWFVYVGRISYSLYLWHWPLLVLGADFKGSHLTYWQAGGVILLSGVISGLSLKYIETPLRRATTLRGVRWARIGAGALAILATFGAVKVIDYAGGGLRAISPRAAAAEEAIATARANGRNLCNASPKSWSPDKMSRISDCAIGPDAAKGRYDVVVWGDSHAGAAFRGLGQAISEMGYTARLQTMPGCPPLIGGRPLRKLHPGHLCTDFNTAVMDEIRKIHPKVVVLVGRWSLWTVNSGESFWLVSDDLPDGEVRSRQNSTRVFNHTVDRTVEELTKMGIKVLLVGQTPEYAQSPNQCVIKREEKGEESQSCTVVGRARAMLSVGPANAALTQAAANHPGASVFLLSDVFCNDEKCIAADGDDFYYVDDNHLSPLGARHAVKSEAMQKVLRQLLGTGDKASASLH